MIGGRAARVGPLAGMLGATFLAIAAVITAVAYSGNAGEAFSPLNHWVSELGERGVSSLAAVFNAGLVVGGIALAIFMIALGLTFRSRPAWLYVPVGVAAGLSGMLVGVFPMNEIGIHRIVALGFFVLGWIAVGVASADIWRRRDPRFATWLPWLGALTVFAFLAFLALYVPSLSYTGTDAQRPGFSLTIALEWGVLIGIMAWTFLASLSWWRAEHGTRP